MGDSKTFGIPEAKGLMCSRDHCFILGLNSPMISGCCLVLLIVIPVHVITAPSKATVHAR